MVRCLYCHLLAKVVAFHQTMAICVFVFIHFEKISINLGHNNQSMEHEVTVHLGDGSMDPVTMPLFNLEDSLSPHQKGFLHENTPNKINASPSN